MTTAEEIPQIRGSGEFVRMREESSHFDVFRCARQLANQLKFKDAVVDGEMVVVVVTGVRMSAARRDK
jgi:hypothetical protein